ncbi:MAG: hypothetical protein AB4080_15400 [Trichodesmium sp.]
MSLSHQKNFHTFEFFREFLELPRKFSAVEKWKQRNDYSMANISGIFVIVTPEKSRSC